MNNDLGNHFLNHLDFAPYVLLDVTSSLPCDECPLLPIIAKLILQQFDANQCEKDLSRQSLDIILLELDQVLIS